MPNSSQVAPESGVFSTVAEVLDELRAGRMVVLTDDEDRENEGDLVLPAQFVTPEAITFMLSVARGYMCLSLTEANCDRLHLPPQAAVNTTLRGTPYTVSIDGHPKHGFTTGVSAAERARAIRMTIDPDFGPDDFVRPGHINPLRSRDGGVLVRIGQTEGSLDLCRLAGLTPAAVIIEIMRDDGEMARLPDLRRVCAEHGLKMCSVRQIIEHRLSQSSIVERLEPVEGVPVRTPEGEFTLYAFRSIVDPLPHLALVKGDIGRLGGDGTVVETPDPVLVRVHRRDLLGDVFGEIEDGAEGSTGQTLRASLRAVQCAGHGVVMYLRPEGIGDNLRQRLMRPHGASNTDRPSNSVHPATLEYGVGSQILRALGVSRLRLLTNSRAEYPQLGAFGLELVERVQIDL